MFNSFKSFNDFDSCRCYNYCNSIEKINYYMIEGKCLINYDDNFASKINNIICAYV